MAGTDESTKHILQSLVANGVIAVAKGGAAFVTGSGALLAETIHSAADCGNQVLLLVGVKRARKPPDATHPFGYGRDLYFWSFIVALFMFVGGGGFSIYEGLHKLGHPELPERVWVGYVILAFSLLIEGAATWENVRELNRRRGIVPFFRYLKRSKDSALVVVFGENAAATVGLILALASLVAVDVTGNPIFDAVGTLLIGVVLVLVAAFLAVEIKSLLVGEAADPVVHDAVRELARSQPLIEEIFEVITVQQGAGEVLVACKARFKDGAEPRQICDAINAFEAELRARHPEVKWCFVEPDMPPSAAVTAAASE